ncbi:MBL fold metallo-hydrolase [Larkinella soli]|uniref:MBL fold metallo-hydrolase n=1 Tax=Larkinella soli TaxID=1770527 RepID=UPI000FFB3341|nr:MBL fold metallo-hydrolase [Larkinella soli]
MVQVQTFVFSPLAENTYVLYDDTREAVIIDPGCYTRQEQEDLSGFIKRHGLTPVKLLNTHAHIDHVLGNAWVKRQFGIDIYLHENELQVLKWSQVMAPAFGVPAYEEAGVDHFLIPGQTVAFGKASLEIRFVPGHAPGHVAFVNHADRFVIGGDVLFKGSIGRTDFPLCDFETLANSIRTQFYTLPDDFTVYPGHFDSTTIGREKKSNPFVKG